MERTSTIGAVSEMGEEEEEKEEYVGPRIQKSKIVWVTGETIRWRTLWMKSFRMSSTAALTMDPCWGRWGSNSQNISKYAAYQLTNTFRGNCSQYSEISASVNYRRRRRCWRITGRTQRKVSVPSVISKYPRTI